MFHVKQIQLPDLNQSPKLELYRSLLQRYHHTLDLMSPVAVANLGLKFAEAQVYAEFLTSRVSPTDCILDLGSGAGLPGVHLALAFPSQPVYWVERRQRRSNFLRIVKSQLELDHVEIVATDVQRLAEPRFRWICAQAVGDFSLLYRLTKHLHTDPVTLVSRRGEVSPAELEQLEQGAGPIQDVSVSALPTHGTLVALRLQGG